MRTRWKFICANQHVCPEVKEKLTRMGFKFLKDTPKSAGSDFVMESDIAEKKISKNDDKVFEACGGQDPTNLSSRHLNFS